MIDLGQIPGPIAVTGFALDVAVVAIVAWLMACAMDHVRHSVLEALLTWGWAAVAVVAGTGVVLGVTGGFGPAGFGTGHFLLLAVVAGWRRRRLAEDGRAFLALRGRLVAALATERGLRPAAGVLGLAGLALAAIGVLAEPAVMDALNYHLPRAAYWLQEGRIRLIGAGDERLDYISGLPEVVIAWLLGPGREGFRGVVLLQAGGGVLALGATMGLARCSGLGRRAALLTGGLLLGLANVVAQFTALQTDLFTAGLFATSFYLWLAALQRGRSSVAGSLGAGLALAAKGTVFYLVPAALLWVVWLAWRHRLPGREWRTTVLAGAAGILLFAGPGLARNWMGYGDVRGPIHWVREFHPELPTLAAKFRKLQYNLVSFAAQACDPSSQPAGLQEPARRAGDGLVNLLPASDPYTFLGQERKAGLRRVLARTVPDADMVSCGILSLALFLLGAGLALTDAVRRRSPGLPLLWSFGVAAFFIYFNLLHQWHPFAFRYYVLIAPWLAVVAGWGIGRLPGRVPVIAGWVVAAATLNVGWRITTTTHQAGWATVVRPQRTLGYHVAAAWREWSQELDHAEAGLRLGLPDDRPLAAFFRQRPPRRVEFLPARTVATARSAAELVQDCDAWVVVPAGRFMGSEGDVAARVWLFHGEDNDPYSVAAYRRLRPGESPRPILYRQRWRSGEGTAGLELLVKNYDQEGVVLALANPAAVPREYEWSTPVAQGRGIVPAGQEIQWRVPLPSQALAEVRVSFPSGLAPETEWPVVRLVE